MILVTCLIQVHSYFIVEITLRKMFLSANILLFCRYTVYKKIFSTRAKK